MKLEEKKGKKADEKKDYGQVVSSTYGDFKGEFRKIIWPQRQELIKQTFTVIVTSLLVGAVIFGFDSVFGFSVNLLAGFLSQ